MRGSGCSATPKELGALGQPFSQTSMSQAVSLGPVALEKRETNFAAPSSTGHLGEKS